MFPLPFIKFKCFSCGQVSTSPLLSAFIFICYFATLKTAPYFMRFLNRFITTFAAIWLGLTCFSVQVRAQDDDFYSLLHDDQSINDFLKPHLSGKILPFTGNEAINKKRLEAAIASNNDKGIITAAGNLGLIHLKKGSAGTALKFFRQALFSAERSQNEKAIGISNIQCGISEYQLRNYDNALDYFQTAQVSVEKQKLPKVVAFVMAQIGQCYAGQRDQRAEETFIRAAKLFAAQNQRVHAAACYNSAGEQALKASEFMQAQEHFTAGLSLIQHVKENKLKGLINRNLGLTDFKRGRFESALQYFAKSLSFDNQLLVHKLVKDTYMQLFTYYSFDNDFGRADVFHDKYRSLKDSLSLAQKTNVLSKPRLQEELEEKRRIIDLLQKQYQEQNSASNAKNLELSQMITKADIELQQKNEALERKTAEVEQLTHEKAIQERDIARQDLLLSKQKHFRNLLLAIAAIAVLLVLMLYNRYSIKKKSNLTLHKANNELKETLSQLRATQDQLVQNEKMASLGQLTAGIAHEIQNPLNFVNNFSEGALDLLDEMKEAKDEAEQNELTEEMRLSLKKINEHGKRAARIVRSMLQHSRQGTGERELTDINQTLHEATNLAFHGMRATYKDFQCQIIENLDPHIPKLTVVTQDISRVLLNITNNAFYAMREKVLKGSDTPSSLQLNTSLNEDKAVIIITDNGPGIPKSYLDKIFQPFFTTKPTGQGTGLGLSISYDIIKAHGGTLQVNSKENEGTTFIIELPVK
jgi:signal transduction histidine kinase